MAGIGELPLAWTEKKGLSACEEHIFQNAIFANLCTKNSFFVLRERQYLVTNVRMLDRVVPLYMGSDLH